MSLNNHPVIIIGAGVGGLSAAAYLTKRGIRPLIIEQTSYPGGRCYYRMIDGVEHDIGALYVGERAARILQEELGIEVTYESYRIGVKINDSCFVSVPFDRSTIKELLKHGTMWMDICHLIMRAPMLFWPWYFVRHGSVGNVVDSLTSNINIRNIGYIMFGSLGVSPYRLPSHYLRLGKGARGTRTGNPVYLSGGNRRIADLLKDFVLKRGGIIRYEERVDRVIVRGDSAQGVITNKGTYSTDYVISNVDIQTTVLKLCPGATWDEPYLSKIKTLRKPLSLVCVFLTLKPSTTLPKRYGAFFVVGSSPIEEFSTLESGQFPNEPTFCIYIPTNISKEVTESHKATLQFYYPEGFVDKDLLDQQVKRILSDGLEKLFPGLSSQVLKYTVYDPKTYEASIGFEPRVFGVAPELGVDRIHQRTWIHNLFCVGDSVKPDRPSVPQAMESGIAVGQMIMKEYGMLNSPCL